MASNIAHPATGSFDSIVGNDSLLEIDAESHSESMSSSESDKKPENSSRPGPPSLLKLFLHAKTSSSQRNMLLDVPRLNGSIGAARGKSVAAAANEAEDIPQVDFEPRSSDSDLEVSPKSPLSRSQLVVDAPSPSKSRSRQKLVRGYSKEDLKSKHMIQSSLGASSTASPKSPTRKFHLTESKRMRANSGSLKMVDDDISKALKLSGSQNSTVAARPPRRGSNPSIQDAATFQSFSDVDAAIAELSKEDFDRSIIESVESNFASPNWREVFASRGGLRAALRALERLAFSQEHRRHHNIALCLSIFTQFLSDNKGASTAETALPEWHRLVSILIGLVHSSSLTVQERTLQLLAKIVLKLNNGYREIKLAVLKALKRRSKVDALVKTELAKFDEWGAKVGHFEWLLRDTIKHPATEASIPVFKSLLGFLNAVGTSVDSLDERMIVRQQIQRAGFFSFFNNPALRDASQLQSDLRVFHDSMASDFEEFRTKYNKTEMATYFDDRREAFDLSPLGHVVVVSARSIATMFVVVVDPNSTSTSEIKQTIINYIGGNSAPEHFDLYFPLIGTGRSRAYSTDTNRIILVEPRSNPEGAVSSSSPTLMTRPRASSALTKGIRLQPNALISEISKNNTAVFLELKMATWNLQVEFVPPTGDSSVSGFIKEVSFDPQIRCGNLPPLLVSLFNIKSTGTEYGVYYKPLDDEESDWPRSGSDSAGTDSLVVTPSKVCFFEPRDYISKYMLNQRRGRLFLCPRLINLTVQVVRDEKSTTIRCVVDPSVLIADLRASIAAHARNAMSNEMGSFINMSKLFLVRSRSTTASTRMQDPRARAGLMDDSKTLSSFGIEGTGVIHIVNQKKPVWVLTANETEHGYHKVLRHIDITLPFSQVISSGALFADDQAANINNATSDVTFLLRHCGKFTQIDQEKTLQDQLIAAYDFIVLERKSSPMDSGSGSASSETTPRNSREMKNRPRGTSSLWDTIRSHSERGYATVLFEDASPTNLVAGMCPLKVQALSGKARTPITTLEGEPPSPRLSSSAAFVTPPTGGAAVRAATFEQLVVLLTTKSTYSADPRFADAFFASLPTMSSVEYFLAKLGERFDVPSTFSEPEQRDIKYMVVCIMLYWIRFYFFVMDLSAHRESIEWIISEIETDRVVGHLGAVASLRSEFGANMMSKIDTGISESLHDFMVSLRKGASLSLTESSITSISRVFLDVLKVEDIARQLTFVCAKLLRGAKVSHLLDNEAWINAADSKTQGEISNSGNCIVALTHLFNQVSDWVAASIVSESTLSMRSRIVKKFLKLLEALKSLNNFHLLMSVLSGLNESSVSRLKWTWSKISTKERESLTKAESLMDFKGSWKNYRLKVNELRSASQDFIPALAIASHDLTFIEEGNPDIVSVDDTKNNEDNIDLKLEKHRPELFNLSKRKQILGVICSVLPHVDPLRTSTKSIYSSLSGDEATQAFIEHLPRLTVEKLYELSLSREPRNASRTDIK